MNRGGTFADETAARLPQSDNVDEWPKDIEVADLNRDGYLDLGVSKWWYRADIWSAEPDGLERHSLFRQLAMKKKPPVPRCKRKPKPRGCR